MKVRTHYLHIRINEEEKRAIKEKAEWEGLSLSDYIRSQLVGSPAKKVVQSESVPKPDKGYTMEPNDPVL